MRVASTMATERPLNNPPKPTLLRRPRPPKPLDLTVTQQLRNKATDHFMLKQSPLKSPQSHQFVTEDSLIYYYENTYPNSRTDFQIHPLHPKGPSFFPPGRKLVTSYQCGTHQLPLSDNSEEMCLESPCGDQSEFESEGNVFPQRRLLTQMDRRIISKQNYLKLTGWFAVNVPTQDSLHTVELDTGLVMLKDRKPRHQVLLELQSMVEEAMSVGFSTVSVGSEEQLKKESPDIVINGCVSRYFCSQGRSSSPFKSSDQPDISPSEMAILMCMTSGGDKLDLKAHFISHPPDLSPLSRTLTHLNLSFNCLIVFPVELLQLSQLRTLLMRNNPIRELPNDIRNLFNLRLLCVSFNLLSDLPPGLFDLHSLVELDVSYNTLRSLSRNIAMLMNLHKLNVEGNQLVGLPSTALSLSITQLLIGDNFTHPVLWQGNTRNQPQELVDMCSMLVSRCVSATDDPRLSEQVVGLLQRCSGQKCDQCQCNLYGCGLRVIRAVRDSLLGISNLPFVFQVCSPSCRTILKRTDNGHWREPFHIKWS